MGILLNDLKAQLGEAIPLGRLTVADNLAKATVWFASSEDSHLTGQSLANR